MGFALHSKVADQQVADQSRTGSSPLTGSGSARRRLSLQDAWRWAEAGAGYQRGLCILLLLGFALRLVMLDRFRFHQDEALYSYWALHFPHDDPYFLKQWIDKPPLFIWLLAYHFKAFGTSEASARLLNIGISTVTIPVAAAIARQAWSGGAGLITAAALALNPFAISFSPTAFTDPLFVLGGVCSVYAAQRSQPLRAGLCLGAAIMTKQQGVFFAPLALAVLMAGNLNGRPTAKAAATGLLRFGGGLALTVLPILYWDSLRWAVAPSPWDLGIRNFGALEIVALSQWPERVGRSAHLIWYLTASKLVWIVLAAAVVFTALYERLARLTFSRRNTVFALLLCGWIGAYWGIHVVASLPLWDRYFLPIAPVFAILAGGIGARIIFASSPLWRRALIGLWILLLLPGGVQAARGQLPIGGDHGAYDGLREAFDWLEGHSPQGAVLYHQPLSWHLQFYLYENPREYRVRWFANPVALVDDAAKMPQRAKFVLVPTWLPLRNRYPHLAAREWELVEQHRAEQFIVYEIMFSGR